MHPGDLHRTPLDEVHRELDAKVGPFAGWAMPVEYEGTVSEHGAVRERVGLFDLSHLGKVDVAGPGALPLLQRTLTNDQSKLAVGRAMYNLVLNDRGGVEEDLIAYRLDEDRFFVVPNASNTAKVVRMLREEASGAEVVEHPGWCFLGVQGPRSPEVVGALLPEAADLAFMGCTETEYRGQRLVLTRSGYTGEVGFELFTEGDSARDLWTELMEAGEPFQIQACGLGARDVLRLEMGYPLYGQDLFPERTPLEAELSWAVSFDKGAFRGRDGLERQKAVGVTTRLRGLVTEGRRHIPRAHCAVLADEVQIGEVTSGTFSPTIQRGVALAYLSPAERFEPGAEVHIDVRGRVGPARVVKPPFVERNPRGREGPTPRARPR
jgi:aminomethyltransferase